MVKVRLVERVLDRGRKLVHAHLPGVLHLELVVGALVGTLVHPVCLAAEVGLGEAGIELDMLLVDVAAAEDTRLHLLVFALGRRQVRRVVLLLILLVSRISPIKVLSLQTLILAQLIVETILLVRVGTHLLDSLHLHDVFRCFLDAWALRCLDHTVLIAAHVVAHGVDPWDWGLVLGLKAVLKVSQLLTVEQVTLKSI